QGGNGLPGMGWSLGGLSAIHRCPKTIAQDGTKGGINYTATDRFCLDGQRLVLVAPSGGVYGNANTEYRTERESFSRITAVGTVGAGPSWFEVRTKSGQIAEYGNRTDAKIMANGQATKVRAWAISKVSDRNGNAIEFFYGGDWGEFYPTEIRYTVNGANPTGFASVNFTYAERSDIPRRYLAGHAIQLTKLLSKIETKLQGNAVREYRLTHSAPSALSRRKLEKVEECILVPANTCFEPTNLTYSVSDAGWTTLSSAYHTPAHVWVRPHDNNGTAFADIDGDGIPDQLMRLWAGSANNGYFYKGSPAGFSATSAPPLPPYYLYDRGKDNGGSALVDLDGDGLTDFTRSLWYSAAYKDTWLNNGAGGSSNWTLAPAGQELPYYLWDRNQDDNIGTALIDVNGDGLPDLVRNLWTSGASYKNVWFNNGTSWTAGTQAQANIYAPPYYLYSRGYDNEGTALVDVNGDGLPDLLRSIWVDGVIYDDAWLNTGAGWVSASQWTPPYPLWSRDMGSEGVAFIDVNGDGLPDMVRYLQTTIGPQQQVWLNNTNGWTAASTVYVPPHFIFNRLHQDNEGTGFVDVDGDGVADFVRNLWEAGVTYKAAYRNKAGRGDLLASVTQAGSVVVEVTYQSISNAAVYALDSAADAYPVRGLRGGGLVVAASTKSSTGLAPSERREVTYFYRDAKIRLQGAGFLGFGTLESTDTLAGLKTVAKFGQAYPYQGLPSESETRTHPAGNLVSKTTNTWTGTPLTAQPGSGGQYHKVELTQSVAQNYELNGAPLPTVTTTTTYD
ncbi:MAG TPA: FG-GAP-like repeat-containing protein, partial [Vicinamibacterales bacterium]|nr:FG-GAP-like repeat-containing protein [Vicinamibacterales bacterium]